MKALIKIFLLVAVGGCGPQASGPASTPELHAFPIPAKPEADTVPRKMAMAPAPIDYDTSQWTELIRHDSTLVIDLRYATSNNFVDSAMYACGRCFLRPKVARAVLAAQQDLRPAGYRLMLLDCYRPQPVQWKLWRKVPDPRFVTDPNKGSMHNRGAAVDLTLADEQGRELDMGTPYDFFGPEAYPAYTQLPDSILMRRRLLSETMLRHGFRGIRTEWWHFAFDGSGGVLADWEWECP